MTREMQRALDADGEKLRQLTGEDHGPWLLADEPVSYVACPTCGGEGVRYEPEVRFSRWHLDPPGEIEIACHECGGAGQIEGVENLSIDDLEDRCGDFEEGN